MMRKPGDNAEPISGAFTYYVGDQPAPGFKRHVWSDGRECWTVEDGSHNTSVDVWQRYASPIWMDINQTRTLQYRAGRDPKDEQHISPLQLDVIERCIDLWSNPGDTVLTPFLGIGSEVYGAVTMGRKGIGIELKPSYFSQAKRNLEQAKSDMGGLFASAAA